MPHDALAAALLTLCRGGEGIPLDVRVTASDEVNELRKRIADLDEELRRTKEVLQRSEFRRGCEMRVRDNILEYCSNHGLQIPRELFSDLW